MDERKEGAVVMTLDQYCQMRYGLGDSMPTKAQRNTVSQMFREGRVKGAFKSGRRWLVDERRIDGK